MSKPIINGIDVSEEIRYCNNCSNLGLDFKARKFYCSLSHRPDELPEVLSCDEFSTNCYIKRLQEENEELKEKNSHKSCLIWYIFNCSKVETIQRLLYEYYECINDDRYNKKRVKKFWDDVFHLRPRRKYKSKYKQALEEIREIAEICMSKNIDNCYTCKFYNECEIEDAEIPTRDVCKLIINKINEVLNER